jgi:hypothetical protein
LFGIRSNVFINVTNIFTWGTFSLFCVRSWRKLFLPSHYFCISNPKYLYNEFDEAEIYFGRQCKRDFINFTQKRKLHTYKTAVNLKNAYSNTISCPKASNYNDNFLTRSVFKPYKIALMNKNHIKFEIISII